jgi:hypothetical protein
MKNHNMQAADILKQYGQFITPELTNRFVKHATVVKLLEQLPTNFRQTHVGESHHKRSIQLIQWGRGPIDIFLWSQMHGDEATGTMALFDLFNFLQCPSFQAISDELAQACTLHFLPMVNPDGAEMFTRRSAQKIDINRDYLQTVTPEARLLKSVREQIKPTFGFNLHDQSTLWSVKKTGNPATLSFLAPPYNDALDINITRKNAMLVIGDIFEQLNPLLPQQIGLFDDEYEHRAFGDNFQAAGMSTILIEAGGLHLDEEKQEIRKYYFLSILTGLMAIAKNDYHHKNPDVYHTIPANNKEIFHLLVHSLVYEGTVLSVGLCYEEEPIQNGQAVCQSYIVQDIGDLRHLGAYQVLEGEGLQITGEIDIYKPANFQLSRDGEIIMSFKNGISQSKL